MAASNCRPITFPQHRPLKRTTVLLTLLIFLAFLPATAQPPPPLRGPPSIKMAHTIHHEHEPKCTIVVGAFVLFSLLFFFIYIGSCISGGIIASPAVITLSRHKAQIRGLDSVLLEAFHTVLFFPYAAMYSTATALSAGSNPTLPVPSPEADRATIVVDREVDLADLVQTGSQRRFWRSLQLGRSARWAILRRSLSARGREMAAEGSFLGHWKGREVALVEGSLGVMNGGGGGGDGGSGVKPDDCDASTAVRNQV